MPPGPFIAIGRLVRQARQRKGWSRRKLIAWILMSPTIDATWVSAGFDVRELEDLGIVMNHEVLRRILDLLEIPEAEVADQMMEARAASAAAFAQDLKRLATTMAADQQRPEREVLTGLVKLVESQRGRPMA